VAALVALTFVTTTLVDFEFKSIAAGHFDRDGLAAFFGELSMGVGLAALGFQLFGTGKLLGRFGAIGALAVLPVSLGLSNAALLAFPALWAATAAKGADGLFRYAVNDPAAQLLYLPVPGQTRAAAKAFIDAVVKPGSIGLAGVMLLAYRALAGGNPYLLAWVSLSLCVAWGALLIVLRPRYIRSLQDTLGQRRSDLEAQAAAGQGEATLAAFGRALESDDPRTVLNALELLASLNDLELDHRVEGLLDHPVPEIRISALRYYAQRETMRFANSVFRKFDDPDPNVRASAIEAFCAMGRDKAVRSVQGYLRDPDPAIRGAAVTGMMRFGGLEGVLMAAEALKALIAHPEAPMRAHAARVLGAIGVQNFYQPLLELMNDPAVAVRRRAIEAAGHLKSPEFVLPLLYRTASASTYRPAVQALAAYGEAVLPTLAKVMANRLEDVQVRRAAAEVLGRVGSPAVAVVIARHLDESDETLRAKLFRALSKVLRRHPATPVERRQVDAALSRELVHAYRALASAEALGLASLAPAPLPVEGLAAAQALLATAVVEKIARAEERVFTLLSVLYPGAELDRIHASLKDAPPAEAGRRRGTAVELLDHLVTGELRRPLLALLEEAPRPSKLRAAEGLIPQRPASAEEALLALLGDETAWVRACAALVAARGDYAIAREALRTACGDASALVREAALVGYAQAVPGAGLPLAQALLQDESPVVRRQAERLAGGALRLVTRSS
jgi:HEAT repeat protein